MSKLASIFELRSILRQMEKDVGLDGLSSTEKDVLLAAHSLTERPGDVIESDQIRNHEFIEGKPPATFHRAMRKLLELGLLKRADGYKSKRYVVRAEVLDK
ncbi:hypothetical protein [Sulfitobacter sediminis]|uniref:hypothetical protein n=1 Tax=Sulfitobacter sediminis TaxID=3234186 RepID=UPI003465483E